MLAKRLWILGFVAMGLACSKGVPESEIVAKVNGAVITKADFEQQVARNMERYRGQNHQLPPSIEARIKESVLRRMIDDQMIEQKAKEVGVVVAPADLEAKFNEYKSRFRTDENFQEYLKRSSNTAENMKADLERNMLRDAVVEKLSGSVEVAAEEIAKYYEENAPRFMEREQIKASRILLNMAPNASEAEKKELRKKARALHAKAVAPGADFAALAKESSSGPHAARGGDLGWIARGRMPVEFDNVAFALEPGQISDPLETKMGFEIVKVFEKRAERQRPLEEVKENIQNSLVARERNEKRREILRSLKAEAKIETLITFEQSVPQPGTAPGAPGLPGGPHGPGMPGKMGVRPPHLPHPPMGQAPAPGMPTGAPVEPAAQASPAAAANQAPPSDSVAQ